MKFQFVAERKLTQLPKSPGVYAFKKGKSFLYIGKAVNLRQRISQHFKKPESWINESTLWYCVTDSEIDALLLEAKLIKKYKPKYNVLWRDDKNFFYVAVTKEKFPQVFLTHQPPPKTDCLGPFVDSRALKQTLKYLRKIFPYYSAKTHPKKLCPWCHLNLCPGPNPNPIEYKKNVKNLIKVLKGERKAVFRKLKKEMKNASKKQAFEKAAKIKNQIMALEKVASHAKIFRQKATLEINWTKIQEVLQGFLKTKNKISRIEAYDVSNIQGKKATGSMITFIEGQANKNFYRRFKIKIVEKPNDLAMLRETLTRRFLHPEWGLPDLILIDGGKAQLNAARQCLRFYLKHIPVVALAKKKNELFIEGKEKPILLKSLPREIFNLILQLRDEAHRFAITYHRKLREVDLL